MAYKVLKKRVLKRKGRPVLNTFRKEKRKKPRKSRSVRRWVFFRRKLRLNFIKRFRKFVRTKPYEVVRRRLVGMYRHAKLSRKVKRQLFWFRLIRGRAFNKARLLQGRPYKYMRPTYYKFSPMVRLRQLQDVYFFSKLKLRAIKRRLLVQYTALLKGFYKEKIPRYTYKPPFLRDTRQKLHYRGGLAFTNAMRIYRRHKFMYKRIAHYAVLWHIGENTGISKYTRKVTPPVNSHKVRPIRSILLRRRLRRLKFKRLRRYRRLTGRKVRKSHYGLHIVFLETKNNFVISCINEFGELIYYVNASSVGASGRRKRFPYTAELCGKRMRKFLYKNRILRVSLVIKSRMRKRMREAIRGLMFQRIRITHIFVRLPITHNGIRYKKIKRK